MSSGCRHTSSAGSTVSAAVSAASTTHVPRQPTVSKMSAMNGGRRKAAAADPIVAIATARPRLRKNHRGTTADMMRKPVPAVVMPPSTP